MAFFGRLTQFYVAHTGFVEQFLKFLFMFFGLLIHLAVIFGKAINRYYLKHAPVLLLGILSLLTVDYIQLLIPELYRLVINGVNLGQVVVDGQTLPFTREVLFQHICLPMIWIVVLMVIGRFLWRVCYIGSAVNEAAE